jgi:hypothetical protein
MISMKERRTELPNELWVQTTSLDLRAEKNLPRGVMTSAA